jgi:hypothetical protein
MLFCFEIPLVPEAHMFVLVVSIHIYIYVNTTTPLRSVGCIY